MTTKFGMRCGCGKAVWAACPNLDGIIAVRSQFAGWGYDERGFVRCPDCLGRDVPAPAVPVAGQGGEQLSLLEVTA